MSYIIHYVTLATKCSSRVDYWLVIGTIAFPNKALMTLELTKPQSHQNYTFAPKRTNEIAAHTCSMAGEMEKY